MRKTVLRLFYNTFYVLFRRARNRRFLSVMGVTPETTVLDVGGTPEFWRRFEVKPKVTILNITETPKFCEFPYVRSSACEMPFLDNSFDIVFSNSMIEHLGTWNNQVAAAKEMTRVGARVWIQTPANSFPIDPHLLTPFVHWLPRRIQARLLPYTLFGWLSRLTPDRAQDLVDEFRLVNKREALALFPHCKFIYERFAGLTKSIIAFS